MQLQFNIGAHQHVKGEKETNVFEKRGSDPGCTDRCGSQVEMGCFITQTFHLHLPADSVFLPLLLRHMKIHEKDPNSTASTTPPSPLKRRRLSSKRKFSHDAEMDREERTPAKKVRYGA